MCGIRKSESASRSNEVWITEMIYVGNNVHFLAPSGCKATFAPYGGNQSHPLWGWILYITLQVLGTHVMKNTDASPFQNG